MSDHMLGSARLASARRSADHGRKEAVKKKQRVCWNADPNATDAVSTFPCCHRPSPHGAAIMPTPRRAALIHHEPVSHFTAPPPSSIALASGMVWSGRLCSPLFRSA